MPLGFQKLLASQDNSCGILSLGWMMRCLVIPAVWTGTWNNAIAMWLAAFAALGFAVLTTTRTKLLRRSS